MLAASPAMIALLNGQQILMADLLTITLVDGTIVRLTSADMDIISGGNTFTSKGTRGKTKTMIGTQVDTLDLSLFGDSTKLIGGYPVVQAAQLGVLDGAYVTLERAMMPTWGDTSAGTIKRFAGRVADVQTGRTEAKVTVNSDLELLNVQFPRNLYQAGCIHTLYDAGCTISRAAKKLSLTANAGTKTAFTSTGTAQAASYFDLGYVTFTSGLNNGLTRTVKSYAPNSWTLMNALPNPVGAGDTFDSYPGCDKTQGTCSGKFANLANFRGFPYIPSPDSLT
jgi:uncharacterized phage protein (TIGR02218 family)